MNIVKFKDVYLEGDSIYNEQLKNKYAIAINWKWIAPMDTRMDKYVYLSQNEHEVPSDFIKLDTYKDYIDLDETTRVNDNTLYIEKNKFTPDDDITLEELKMFRTWLARTIYNIYVLESDIKLAMNYYANEMYDDTVKNLILSSPNSTQVALTSVSKGCSCCQDSYSVLYNSELSTCDPVYFYRKNLYGIMVKNFSDLSFWLGKLDVCKEMKKYIDNIIKMRFPLSESEYLSTFADCQCLNNDSQERYMSILKNLSSCLEMIVDGTYTGSKNFISETLNQWASLLYENMRW